MNQLTKRPQGGFTIIELMLAMAFVAMLLLAIAMTIVQIANIYNKGLLIKEINQVSRTVNDDLSRVITGAGSFSVDPADRRYLSTPWGGRMCLGQFSYVWNFRSALASGGGNLNRYSDGSAMNLAKVPDSGATLCTPNSDGIYPNVNPANAIELVKAGEHSLSLHSFSVISTSTAADSKSRQQLYTVSYRVGTSDLNALDSTQTNCKAPNVSGADPTYCSIQQFALVVRVVDGVN